MCKLSICLTAGLLVISTFLPVGLRYKFMHVKLFLSALQIAFTLMLILNLCLLYIL